MHSHLLEVTKLRKAPKILLNVEVMEAMILKPANVNGFSHPFCTLYLVSNDSLHCSTSVKPETLKPIWEEKYQLPIENSTVDDVLCVKLWNFNGDKTVEEKLKNIKKVKGVKGLKILLKDVASSASLDKHDRKMIGSSLIPLKDIPAGGHILSCSVCKKDKMKKRGDVKLRLAFHFENTNTAFQEHMYLIKNVVLYEIKMSQVEPHSWNGSLSRLAEKILTQHRVQSGLPLVSELLAQWIEFSNIHTCHPLSFTVFMPLKQKLSMAIQEGLVTEEEKILFWKAAVTLLPSLLSGIRNIQVLASSKRTINEPSTILSLLTLFQELQPPKDVISFPAACNDCLPWRKSINHSDIRATVIETTTEGAAEWFTKVTEEYGVNDVSNEEEKIRGLLSVVTAVTESLQKAFDLLDPAYQKYFNFQYADTLYKLCDDKLSEIIEPTVASIWNSMNPLKFKDGSERGVYDNDPLSLGSLLFELYTSLQTFYRTGHTKSQKNLDLTLPNKFHQWFHPGVIHWLHISQYKALQGIQKAVQLDRFVPVYTATKCSSSACDILHIFVQMKISWEQLAWPDASALKHFAEKLIGGVCECLIFYADQMCERIEEIYNGENINDMEIQAWCLAVTNMDHVQQSVHSIWRFGVDEIDTSDNEIESSSTENNRQTVKVIIDNTIEAARNKICEVAIQKMMPSTSKILMKAFEDLDYEQKIAKFMSHLDWNLQALCSHLDSSNFNCLLNLILKNLGFRLSEVLEINLKLQREHSFFKKFYEVLQNLTRFFKQLNESTDVSSLTDLEQLLQVHVMDTWELVHQYRMEQLSEQKAKQTPDHGLLTVKMMFMEEILKIEILNARNLQPVSSKGSCHPYVKIYLLPENKFLGVTQRRTKVQKNTAFPLFEETFVMPLTSVQLNVENAMVMFVVKEKTFLRRNRYLGETFISFDDIPRYDGSTKFEHLEQMHLKLNPPTKLDSGAFVVLEHYREELVREFIRGRKLSKYKNNTAHNIHAFSADVWHSIISVMSYMSKGPLHIICLPFLPHIGIYNHQDDHGGGFIRLNGRSRMYSGEFSVTACRRTLPYEQ
ncbi:Unc-13-like protein D [Zootermopsis nevadensis]|uniref:Unc-13-like protein D n=1 Tax=Zootermopsis nevadensis TaxID=136037 RepID=A0A067RHE6_ZOONE|nr:Unc-13-like protein D [Zootermopsis nevadensis]